jgi:hypothetical protein
MTSAQKITSTQSKTSGATANPASKNVRNSPQMVICLQRKKIKVPSSAVPSNADDSDIVKLADGTQVMASEVQIIEVADSSQVYEADQPFRPVIRVDNAKVQAHKRLFYEQLEGH